MALIPKNWHEFQHYKDRKPVWIKLHRALLDDFDFFRLPLASKALAPFLWLLASEYEDGAITAAPDEIAYRLRMSVDDLRDGLIPLLDHNFFHYNNDVPTCFQSASSVLAERERISIPEKERETETQEQTEGHSPPAERKIEAEDSPVMAKAISIAILPKLFDQFWSTYPNREGRNPKEPARKKFFAAVKSGDDADAIIAGARGYADEMRRTNKLDTPFVAQAVTWLNQKSWTDYQAKPAAPITVDPDPGVPIDPVWAPARARLLVELGADVFASWFRNVTFIGKTDDGRVRMTAPTRFIKDWIEKSYMPQLLRAWRPDMPEIIAIEIDVRTAS